PDLASHPRIRHRSGRDLRRRGSPARRERARSLGGACDSAAGNGGMKRVVPFAMLLLAFAATAAPDVPRIAVIIDDIGDRYVEGEAAVRLPGPVALALPPPTPRARRRAQRAFTAREAATRACLPHTPQARRLAELAFQARKEVLLHRPLRAMEDKLPGPGAITLDTTEGEFRRLLEENLAAVPHAGGVNNHMGSLITR